MAPTTRRQSRLMSAELEVWSHDLTDQEVKARKRRSNSEPEGVQLETTKVGLEVHGHGNEDGGRSEPVHPGAVKERTFSMQMTDAIEALHRSEEEEEALHGSSDDDDEQRAHVSEELDVVEALHRSHDEQQDQHEDIPDPSNHADEDENRAAPPSPSLEFEELGKTEDEDEEPQSDSEDPESESHPEPEPYSPSHPALSLTRTPPARLPILGASRGSRPDLYAQSHHQPPQQPAQTRPAIQPRHETPTEPWVVMYICYKCEQPVNIRGGAGVYNPETGASMDRMRCRECGCRVLWKQRTKRMVQFEAR